MITQLHAKNFKSWKDTGELRIAPLTGFFGTNSSGKTSLLQMLLLLKQTAASTNRRQVLFMGDKSSLVDLGTFYDVIHKHQREAQLELSASWTLHEPLTIENPETQGKALYSINRLSCKIAIHEKNDLLHLQHFLYAFDDDNFGMQQQPNKPEKYELTTKTFQPKRSPGRVWPLPPPVKCYGFPDEAFGYFQNTGFLADFPLAFEQMLSNVFYLGPLRDYPQRDYLYAGTSPDGVGKKGEEAVAALLSARARDVKISYRLEGNKRKKHVSIEQRIGDWLQQMGLIHSFELKAIAPNRKEYELRIKKTKHSSEVLITDVGFGVSQVLTVLVLCYYAPEYSTIIFEQPEIHLHPAVQAFLADVFVEVTTQRNVQIIFESHSEYLLHRLQRRIAEQKITAEQIALYFCEMGESASEIKSLKLDSFGNITNWPPDFFGDATGDLIAMVEAATVRQMQEQA